MASQRSGLRRIFDTFPRTQGREPRRPGKKLRLEALEERRLLSVDGLEGLAAPNEWHNTMRAGDVNNDGFVSPIDALIVLNVLNATGARPLSTPSQSASGPVAEGELEQALGAGDAYYDGNYYDVNRDFYVTPADALVIINQLNAEGAPPSVTFNADSLGAISGFIYNDVTGDGITPASDIPVNGEFVRLVTDSDGDGVYTLADIPSVFSALPVRESGHTGVDGEYRFEGLSAGTYFVVREAGLQGFASFASDANVVTVELTASQAAGVAATTIDDFSAGTMVTLLGDDYNVLVAPNALPIVAGAGQVSPVGNERELAIRRTSFYGSTSATAQIDLTDGNLTFTNTAGAWGEAWVTWDGTGDGGDATTVDPTGLGGLDFTNGGAGSLITLTAGADRAGAVARIYVYTDADNWSEIEMPIPETSNAPGAQDVDVILARFTDFTVMDGTGADFTNVGAVQLFIEDAQNVGGTPFGGLDGRLRFVGTHGMVTNGENNFRGYWPAAIGNRVWIDTNGNGTYDTGEGVNGVELSLWIDENNNGTLDASESADPGQYRIATIDTGNDAAGDAGWYEFNSSPGIEFLGSPGDYIVQVTSPNFNGLAPLDGYRPIGGTVADPDDDVDNDNNGQWADGIENGPNGVVAMAVTITSGGEPADRTVGVGTSSYDIPGAYNPTIDFGFIETPSVITDLAITKVDSADPVFTGDQLTYTIEVTNNGPVDANNVTVTDTLPADVTFISASRSATEAGDVITVNLGFLAVGASATIDIVVQVDAIAPATILNVVEVACDEEESDYTNNRADEPTEVIGVAPAPASVAGYVYVDMDNDGQKDSDGSTRFDGNGNEGGIAGVSIVLTGTTDGGVAVAMTTFTDEFGYYAFTGMAAGNYTVREIQPVPFIDGRDTPGVNTAPGPQIQTLQVLDDEFVRIGLQSGMEGNNFNFGEQIPSKREYLASTN